MLPSARIITAKVGVVIACDITVPVRFNEKMSKHISVERAVKCGSSCALNALVCEVDDIFTADEAFDISVLNGNFQRCEIVNVHIARAAFKHFFVLHKRVSSVLGELEPVTAFALMTLVVAKSDACIILVRFGTFAKLYLGGNAVIVPAVVTEIRCRVRCVTPFLGFCFGRYLLNENISAADAFDLESAALVRGEPRRTAPSRRNSSP